MIQIKDDRRRDHIKDVGSRPTSICLSFLSNFQSVVLLAGGIQSFVAVAKTMQERS